MFFVVRSNDSFNFQLGLIKYLVIVNNVCLQLLSYTLCTLTVSGYEKLSKIRVLPFCTLTKYILRGTVPLREKADWKPVEVNVSKSESKFLCAIYCSV